MDDALPSIGHVAHRGDRGDFSFRTSMKTKFPCSAYQETNGIVFFARMLDKIRLNASGELPPGYFLGTADPTFFDARSVKFLASITKRSCAELWKAAPTRKSCNGAFRTDASRQRKKSWSGTSFSSNAAGVTKAAKACNHSRSHAGSERARHSDLGRSPGGRRRPKTEALLSDRLPTPSGGNDRRFPAAGR